MAKRKTAKQSLHAASDAFFAMPIDLAQDLDRDPQGTIRLLQRNPARIAPLRPSLQGEWFRRAHLRLLMAALAYVKTEQSDNLPTQ